MYDDNARISQAALARAIAWIARGTFLGWPSSTPNCWKITLTKQAQGVEIHSVVGEDCSVLLEAERPKPATQISTHCHALSSTFGTSAQAWRCRPLTVGFRPRGARRTS